MSAQEIAEWRREEQLAAQRKAEDRAAFGQMLTAGVAMAGVAAAGGDLSAVPLTGNPLDILNGANAEIARQNARGQAQLDATIAAAQRSGSGGPVTGSASTNLSSVLTSPSAAEGPVQTSPRVNRAIRFYFVGGMVPRPADTRNPRCYSNVVTVTADLPQDRSEASIEAHRLAEGYRGSFASACASAGSGPLNDTYVTVEGFDSGWPYPSWHPSDVAVRLQ